MYVHELEKIFKQNVDDVLYELIDEDRIRWRFSENNSSYVYSLGTVPNGQPNSQ